MITVTLTMTEDEHERFLLQLAMWVIRAHDKSDDDSKALARRLLDDALRTARLSSRIPVGRC